MPVGRAIASLHLALDPQARRPLYEQIFEAMRARILAGHLAPASRLPGSRALARELGVARATVLQAFDALAADGYIVAVAASATRVAAQLPSAPVAPARRLRPLPGTRTATGTAIGALSAGAHELGAMPRPFRPGVPALDRFPLALWARLAGRTRSRASAALLDGGGAQGLAALRDAIANHVREARGIACTAEQVFVTSGSQHAFDEVLRLVCEPGDAAWVEDPGHLGTRRAVLGAHLRPVAVPVDAEGLDVAAGIARAPAARVALLAPSHHYPLGATLAHPRRLALLRWAARARATIVEDDYDSEFRHRGAPPTPLAGLDERGCVVHVGTFSKSLFPGLRVGYFIAPARLVDTFAGARRGLGAPASAFEQATVAAFFAGGHFASHLRRMRALYRERCEALQAALAEACGDTLAPLPCDTGMQLAARLVVPGDDEAIARAAAEDRVEVAALTSYGVERHERGLLLGFGGVPPAAMREAAERLARAITRVSSSVAPRPRRAASPITRASSPSSSSSPTSRRRRARRPGTSGTTSR